MRTGASSGSCRRSNKVNPLNVLHIIRNMDPRTGGPPRVVADLATEQGVQGARVSILCQPIALEAAFGDSKEALPALLKPGEERDFAGFDILHLHGVWDPFLLAAARKARRANVPYVVAPHGMLDPWSLKQKKWKKKLALFLGYRKMLDSATGLHLLNADEARLIEPLKLRAEPFVLSNGVHLLRADQTDAVEASFREFLDESPYLLFLSRIHRKKGLDFLVPAFAKVLERHPKLRLLIAGPDDGERSNVEALARGERVADRVCFTGPLYGARKWSALKSAVCFCLTSRQEGFSIAILEALSTGLPVVISEECHFPEVAAAGAGIVVTLDAANIAEALDDLLADPIRRLAMGEAGHRLVDTNYTWPAIATRSLTIYAGLLSHGTETDGPLPRSSISRPHL